MYLHSFNCRVLKLIGLLLQVFHKTAEGQQKTKSFRIATSSSYSEVLLVCCKKFRVKRAGDFMLLELNRSTGGE